MPVLITGDRRLEAKLRALPLKVQSRVIGQALRASAKRPRTLARNNAKAIKQSGNLAKSIGSNVKVNRRDYVATAWIGPRTGFDAANGQPAAKYGTLLERGAHGMQPVPFLRSALEATRPHLLKDFQAAIGAKIVLAGAKK